MVTTFRMLGLWNLAVEFGGIVQFATHLLSTIGQLPLAVSDNHITGLYSILLILLSKVQVEMRTPFQQSFFRGGTVTKGFLDTTITIIVKLRLGLLHVEFKRLKMMLEFKVDGTFSSRERDRNDVLFRWDLVNFRNVLKSN
jgi:hypothetical protein